MHFRGSVVLRSVSLVMHAGEFIAIGGPNGAGKSTLLSVLSGLATPTEGTCAFLNREVHSWPRRDFARQVAVVTQSEAFEFPFTAREVVAMGRMPFANSYFESETDRTAIAQAIEQTGVQNFQDRQFQTLSGGERQRVLLASALAQQPRALLLDEPSTHLDLHHQVSLHQLLRQLRDDGLLIVTVTHDLNLAAAYSDRLLLLHKGEIRADGSPASVLSPSTIRDVFEVDAEIGTSLSGKVWFSYGPLNA